MFKGVKGEMYGPDGDEERWMEINKCWENIMRGAPVLLVISTPPQRCVNICG